MPAAQLRAAFDLCAFRNHNRHDRPRESSNAKAKCIPNFFHSNAHPGNEVVATGVFVIIYSSLSLAIPLVVFVFPWLVNFLLALYQTTTLSIVQ